MSLQNWREKYPVISHGGVMCQWLTKTSWSTRWRYGSTLVAGYLIIVYCWILLVRSHSCKVKPSKSKAYQQVSPGCKPEELWIFWPFLLLSHWWIHRFRNTVHIVSTFRWCPAKSANPFFLGPGSINFCDAAPKVRRQFVRRFEQPDAVATHCKRLYCGWALDGFEHLDSGS